MSNCVVKWAVNGGAQPSEARPLTPGLSVGFGEPEQSHLGSKFPRTTGDALGCSTLFSMVRQVNAPLWGLFVLGLVSTYHKVS